MPAISDADMQALYAYFKNGVQPVAQPNKAEDIPWPLSMRWPLTYWRWLFAPSVQATPVAASNDPLRDRGAYLVEGLGHCGTCHTPRGLALQEKALTDRDGPAYLSGGLVDNYVADNLRGDAMTGLGSWSEDDIVQFLKTGRNDQDRSLRRHDRRRRGQHAVHDRCRPACDRALPEVATGTRPGSVCLCPRRRRCACRGERLRPGSLDYLNNCAACHLSSGKGYVSTFPALAGNPVVNATDPSSLISIVLHGDTEPATDAVPTDFTMPSFGARLNDQEIADVVTFIRSNWGNKAPAVTPDQVAKIRAAPHAPISPYLKRDPRATHKEASAGNP